MKGKTYSVKNIYQLLKTRQFVNPVSCEVNNITHTVLEYGVPGTFLRQNVKRMWWRNMVEEQSNAFPIEKSASFNLDDYLSLITDQSNRTTQNLDNDEKRLKEYRSMYLDVVKLNKGCLPFSIVSSHQRINVNGRENNDDGKEHNQAKEIFMSDLIQNTLVSQCYTAPSGVNRVFDFWFQQRLSWWKKYAKNPSKFSAASSSDNKQDCGASLNSSFNVNGQLMSINYEFPWGLESVEVVQNHGDAFFRDLPESKDKSYWGKTTHEKKTIPFCIQCTMNLDTAATTFLIDAYHERRSLSNAKTTRVNPVLQLHPKLSPFQSALYMASDSVSTMNELSHVCTKLEQDLQRAGISVFNASRHGATQEAHFRRNDQLGIPYTLVLSEKTLLDGSIVVRCRDTEIMKPVHVSKAVEELRRNVEAFLE